MINSIEITQLPALFNRKADLTLPEKIEIVDGGLTSEREYLALALLCSLQQPKKIFEIGTFKGESARLLSLNSPFAHVFTLDLSPYSKKTKYDLDEENKKYIEHDAPEFKRKIKQLFGDSATFDFAAYKGQMEFIFVDGAYTYEYTKNDTEKAFEMSSSEGMIVWHDYASPHWPETNKFLEEIGREKELYHIKGTYLLFWKSKKD